MLVEYIEFAMCLVLGVAVGCNLRSEQALKAERKTFEMVDGEIRKRLEIAENLNSSLKEDIKFLRGKIDYLNQKIVARALER